VLLACTGGSVASARAEVDLAAAPRPACEGNAPGLHIGLIVRSISLSAKHLLFEFAFIPEPPKGAEVWLNMSYGADIPTSQDYMGIGDEVQYTRPPLGARHAWFDFFRPDYEWMVHFDRSGQPDSDYQRNRIARLTFDLRTGEAQIEK
jgi:hypothetical protein